MINYKIIKADSYHLQWKRAEFVALTNQRTKYDWSKAWILIAQNDVDRMCKYGYPASGQSGCPRYFDSLCPECLERGGLFDCHELPTSLWTCCLGHMMYLIATTMTVDEEVRFLFYFNIVFDIKIEIHK